MDNNHANIEEAEFIENISISGGSEFSSSIEASNSFSQTITTSLSLGQDIKAEFMLEESGSGFTIGLENEFRFEIGTNTTFGQSYSHTTGYTLTDDDAGDFMSIDIFEDKVYGTPAFKVKAGTTSCPWETDTQPREGVQLRADNYTVNVNDPAGEAVFILQLANTSESNEDNTYELIFDATSNPDGALVSVGGSPVVGNIPTPYDIPAGQSVQATVTVKKGPYSSAFKGLKFTLRSECDGNIEDVVYLNALFETNCGDISMTPVNLGNTISQSTGNTISVNLADYTKESLNSINLRVRNQVQDWSTLQILTGADIGETDTDVDISFENMYDEIYFVKAVAMCSSDAIESEIMIVTVDRTAPIVLYNEPYNEGLMELGDGISVSFNEAITALENGDISIMNLSSGLPVQFEYGCSETKVVLLPVVSDLQDGDTIEVSISNVSDIYANVMDAFSWTFSIPSVEEVLEDPMLDSDKDGIPNSVDICVLVYNPNQLDMDEDNVGDACDDDIDGDGVMNIFDKCPFISNSDQLDIDNDGIGDACDDDMDGDAILDVDDNCSSLSNSEQSDMDFDGLGDVCDDDMDGDGYDNAVDNCPGTYNPNQTDSNNNGIGDVCDATDVYLTSMLGNIKVYPNPFDSELRFEYYLKESLPVKIELCNFMGQTLQIVVNEGLFSGYHSEIIKIGELSAGIYLIKITVDSNSYFEKIIKL